MRPQTRSILVLSIMIMTMVGVGFLLNSYNSTLTGAVVGTQGIACHTNDDCDDHRGCTVDSCKNSGTDRSFCVNSPIRYCHSGDGCCPQGCTENTDEDC